MENNIEASGGKHATLMDAAMIAAEWEGLLAEFEVYQHAGAIAAKSITNREECYRVLAARSGKSATQITKMDLLQFMSRPHFRTGQQLAAGTKQAERSYLRSFFAWMYEQDLRPDDPAKSLPKVKVPRRRPRPLRPTQIDAILDGGAYARTRTIITIAALTGLRIGEVVKIKGEDVDLEGGVLYSLRKGGFEHTVPLHPTVQQIATEMPRTGWWFPSPYPSKLFPKGGGHILMESASDAVSNAIRRAGITDRRVTAHSLRHFYASQLLAEGANIRVIQEMMGHASLATTQIYTEVTDGQMRRAVEMLGGIETRKRSGRTPAKQAAPEPALVGP
jgi:integrase/recombinase XerD